MPNFNAKHKSSDNNSSNLIDKSLNNESNSIKFKLDISKCKKTAYILIKMLEKLDNFERLSPYLQVNDNYIKVNPDILGGNFLGFIFALEHSNVYSNEGKIRTRVFDDHDFNIKINNRIEKCRLSTEWVGIPLDAPKQSANYVYALINIINQLYSDALNIFESNGEWYLEKMSNLNNAKVSFTFENIPESFNTSFAKRYICSLMTKPFVILTGNSGTGKTRIATHFAKFLEVKLGECEKNWLLVPVGADWTDNSKILGFYNPLADNGKGKYEKSSILRLIELANLPENKDIPFFIILDEMNLSHVERYFADFLSHMETPEIEFVLDGYSGSLKYPQNLFIVGTVNIDETTYMFSPKVLDRANVIEFIPEKEP